MACEAGSVINYLIGKVALETNQPFKIGPERRITGTDLFNRSSKNRSVPVSGYKWKLLLDGNVGTGDTELSWEVFGGVGYKFTTLDLVAGYQHMQWDFDSNDAGGEILKNLKMSGPIVGVNYYF